MPIYEYKCAECGQRVEKMQKVSDQPLTACDNCGGKLEKQWSLSGFQFKGEGWYVTDYSGKKGDAAAKSENGEKTSTAPEKTSASESTVKTEAASNNKSDGATTAKETVSKKE
jgi:putative FmdB family regulatory protein